MVAEAVSRQGLRQGTLHVRTPAHWKLLRLLHAAQRCLQGRQRDCTAATAVCRQQRQQAARLVLSGGWVQPLQQRTLYRDKGNNTRQWH